MPSSLSLISLNIEGDKHFERTLPFVKKEKPDVLCVQELFQEDIHYFNNEFSNTMFVPMALRARAHGGVGTLGVGIFSRFPIVEKHVRYYAGDGTVRLADLTSAESKERSILHALALCDVAKEGGIFRIATTHFPWTPDGSASDFQRRALKDMLAVLEKREELVLCGDFNAPRGGEIFSVLANKYKDNVPPEYVTSLDLDLHRAGKTRPHELDHKMVDGLFSTPAYRVSEVRLVSGVSDHCALVGKIERL